MIDGLLAVRSCLAAVLLGWQAGDPGRAVRSPGPLGEAQIAVSFESAEGWTYDGRIELPAADRRKPWAVMLLGGGLGTDIDWQLPGILTIDGKPTYDGATLAKALLDEGFVIMRWNAIRRGDQRHAEDPLMMDAPKLAQTFDHARRALAAFRAQKVVPDDHIFLLGHSLGGRRAGILLAENPKLPGVVMMAGAHLLPSDVEAAKRIVRRARDDFRKADANNDGYWGGREFERARKDVIVGAAGSANFGRVDWNADGKIDSHELTIAALDVQSSKYRKKDAGPRDNYGHKWTADVIAEHRMPTLLVVGVLDERWLIELYLMVLHQQRIRHPDIEFEIYEGIGHQLAQEVPGDVTHEKHGVIAHGRAAPIEQKVVRRMVDWIKARAR